MLDAIKSEMERTNKLLEMLVRIGIVVNGDNPTLHERLAEIMKD